MRGGILKMKTIREKDYPCIVKEMVVNHFNALSETYDEKSTKRENQKN